jgi:hypothetical protein
MLQLDVAHKGRRYYLCPRCGTVREDVSRSAGRTPIAHFHPIGSAYLPANVVERAQAILAHPSYRQLPLFGDL